MRNKTIDQSRLFAALLVVVIHAPIPGVIGAAIESIARLAVPFFFMLSGYFAFDKDRHGLFGQAIKNLRLFIFALAVNFGWDVVLSLLRGNAAELLSQRLSLTAILEGTLLNTGVLVGHLWFLLALVYVYVLYALFLRESRAVTRACVGLTLLVALYSLRELLRWMGVADVVYYLRNFLFVGMPLFVLGTLAAEHRDKLVKIKPVAWTLAGIVGAALSVVERLTLGSCDVYLGTPLLAAAFFALSALNILPCSNLFAELGRKYSRDIYVFHTIVLGAINIFASLLGILQNTVFLFVRPVTIIVACIFGLWVIYKILNFKNQSVKD